MAAVDVGVLGKVGDYNDPKANGAEVNLRMTRERALVVSQSSGEYTEDASHSILFNAANQAAQAISVALNTTYTGLLLFNPVNSGYDLVPLACNFCMSVAPAAPSTLGLIQGFAATGGLTVAGAAVPISNNYIGGVAGVGRVFSSGTIVAPTWLAHLQSGFTAGALPVGSGPWDLKGAVAIQPGGFIAIGALTAVTGLGHFFWKETKRTQ